MTIFIRFYFCCCVCTGQKRNRERTGVGTIAYFGTTMVFDVGRSFPLLTTKRVNFNLVLEELLWFIRGDTNVQHLRDRGVHIWDGNTTREYLDSINLHDRAEYDAGPIYGFQWRHFGAKYIDCFTDYTGQGVDQLQNIIDLIRNDPENRRLVMSAWNPLDMDKMVLPPCHMQVQFYVNTEDNTLDCMMTQRSGDMGLGVPFNIASYALLMHMIAHVCDLKPGMFTHIIGDTHVYCNHLDNLAEQLRRKPRPFPQLIIKRKVTSIDDFKFDDFEIVNYNPYPRIQLTMAVGTEKLKNLNKSQ